MAIRFKDSIRPRAKPRRIIFNLPDQIFDPLTALCEKTGLTQAAHARRALEEYLKRQQSGV